MAIKRMPVTPELKIKTRRVSIRKLDYFCKKRTEDFHSYGKKIKLPNGKMLFYQDNGSNILAIAHLDSVQKYGRTGSLQIGNDLHIYSPVLDNRLGVYTILEHLKQLGLKFDVLLTDDEEQGQSTAQFFEPPSGKKYNWMFSFDRRGTDVVMYDYENRGMKDKLEKAGFRVGTGSYSDICYLDHLGCKGFNFGNGLKNGHAMDASFNTHHYYTMVNKFVRFFKANKEVHFAHRPAFNQFSLTDGLSHKSGLPKYMNFTEAQLEYCEYAFQNALSDPEAYENFRYTMDATDVYKMMSTTLKLGRKRIRRLKSLAQAEKLVADRAVYSGNKTEKTQLSSAEATPRIISKNYKKKLEKGDLITLTEVVPNKEVNLLLNPNVDMKKLRVNIGFLINKGLKVTLTRHDGEEKEIKSRMELGAGHGDKNAIAEWIRNPKPGVESNARLPVPGSEKATSKPSKIRLISKQSLQLVPNFSFERDETGWGWKHKDNEEQFKLAFADKKEA